MTIPSGFCSHACFNNQSFIQDSFLIYSSTSTFLARSAEGAETAKNWVSVFESECGMKQCHSDYVSCLVRIPDSIHPQCDRENISQKLLMDALGKDISWMFDCCIPLLLNSWAAVYTYTSFFSPPLSTFFLVFGRFLCPTLPPLIWGNNLQ